jgi:hypothetical protein
MLHNLVCVIEHFTLFNPSSDAEVEQFADLYCMDYHPTVEGSSVVKGGYHVSLSSIGGSSIDESSTDDSAPGSPGASSVGSYNPAPGSIQEEVQLFKTSGHIHPSVQELHKEFGENPKKIFEHSNALIAEVEAERDELLDKIASEQDQNKIEEDEVGLLKDEANLGAKRITTSIQETNDVAVDAIDDTSDTEEFIFNKKKP